MPKIEKKSIRELLEKKLVNSGLESRYIRRDINQTYSASYKQVSRIINAPKDEHQMEVQSVHLFWQWNKYSLSCKYAHTRAQGQSQWTSPTLYRIALNYGYSVAVHTHTHHQIILFTLINRGQVILHTPHWAYDLYYLIIITIMARVSLQMQ